MKMVFRIVAIIIGILGIVALIKCEFKRDKGMLRLRAKETSDNE